VPTGSGASRQCRITDRQAQRTFKHAADFGVSGSYNPANATQFRAAILTA